MSEELIRPDWPAPSNVHAFISTRKGGVSTGPYASMNLGDHVDDTTEHVSVNRSRFAKCVGLDQRNIVWLKQVHGTHVEDLDLLNAYPSASLVADASTVTKKSVGCVIMTADCMPVLLCDRTGSRVAAVHAGWRGMEQGVIQAALKCFERPQDVIAYMGPTISKAHFEVGAEVKSAFELRNSRYSSAFKESVSHQGSERKYMCDLYDIARTLLQSEGVSKIYGGEFCTYAQSELFHSYRRDGKCSGRMASLIYIS